MASNLKDLLIPASPPPHDDQDSWTTVTSKSRSKSKSNSKQRPRKPRTPPDQNHAPAPRADSDLRSVKDIAAEFRTLRAHWAESPCAAALRAILAAKGPSVRRVSRAVCLGIGSFDPVDGSWEAKRKTYLQLISFLDIVEHLEKYLNAKIPCLFQEPVFTNHDRSFLESLGHSVLESPAACDAVDPHTLLYGVHLYRPIYAIALRAAAPAVFVGTGWDVWDQVDLSPGPSADLAHLQEIEETYNKFAFPQDATTTAFSSTSIYFRPPVS
ncbi:hypothetical protein ESCO_000015 [Escovopsis weberi]|uniref:SRR1-like domain-containing protein n=1 Tax=Escovopsis weberi TaxID=150374 RepID=A0A0M9VTL0_ESCWE|nr:hypothetical protein ESCO_000015 [Escovopsis weberi]